MTKKFPTNLEVGDVMHSKTGRTYTVTYVDEDTNTVSYAYIPAGAIKNKIALDTRTYSQLHWVVLVVNNKGHKVYEANRPATVGDEVKYKGQRWEVIKDNSGYLTLRVVLVDVNRELVEVL